MLHICRWQLRVLQRPHVLSSTGGSTFRSHSLSLTVDLAVNVDDESVCADPNTQFCCAAYVSSQGYCLQTGLACDLGHLCCLGQPLGPGACNPGGCCKTLASQGSCNPTYANCPYESKISLDY